MLQLYMLAANHRTEHGDFNEGAKERTEGDERGCNLMINNIINQPNPSKLPYRV